MIRDFENKHKGEVGLVIGNGPSLKKVTPDLLNKYPSFGTNRIYLLEDFIPTYYVAVNPLVIEQSAHEINELPCVKFIREAKRNLIPGCVPLPWTSKKEFSFKPWLGLYEGYNVTFVCLELAFFMGFETVLLIGVDHRYRFQGNPNQEIVSQEADPNHFNEAYFGPGVRWNLPDLAKSEESYNLALQAYSFAGRQIINLTPRSALDIFDKGKYADWK